MMVPFRFNDFCLKSFVLKKEKLKEHMGHKFLNIYFLNR